MDLPSVWDLIVAKEVGLLAVGGGIGAVVGWVLKYRLDKPKIKAETRKIELEADSLERTAHQSQQDRVRDCARDIYRSVSAVVDELFATFYLFAYPPTKVSRRKLQAALALARRFRHEQRYRAEIESLLAEFHALGCVGDDDAVPELRTLALSLLAKIAEKKVHVGNIEGRGLTPDNAAAVAAWLDDIRELRVRIGSAVGRISGELSLGQDAHEKVDRAACDVAQQRRATTLAANQTAERETNRDDQSRSGGRQRQGRENHPDWLDRS